MLISIKFIFGVFCFIANCLISIHSLSKVVVPSVYKEWETRKPDWTSESFQREHNFSVFLYQKLDSSAPNYIATNRGTEAGVYLRYIVDHFDSFPDVAVFTHAVPEEHSPDWLDRVKCIRPNATYYSLNDVSWRLCRDPSGWHTFNEHVVLMEQCWRDVLQTAWGYNSSSDEEFLRRLPPKQNIEMCASCCQQFLLSRGMVQAKPLRVWKQLLEMIGVRNECHKGPIDYSVLYAKTQYKYDESNPATQIANNYGQLFQGMTMEHLAHVVYGQQPLMSPPPTMRAICDQFLPSTDCPGSPCNVSAIGKPFGWRYTLKHKFTLKHTMKPNNNHVLNVPPPTEPSRGDYKPQQIKPKVNPHDPQLQHHMQHTRPGNQHQH